MTYNAPHIDLKTYSQAIGGSAGNGNVGAHESDDGRDRVHSDVDIFMAKIFERGTFETEVHEGRRRKLGLASLRFVDEKVKVGKCLEGKDDRRHIWRFDAAETRLKKQI